MAGARAARARAAVDLSGRRTADTEHAHKVAGCYSNVWQRKPHLPAASSLQTRKAQLISIQKAQIYI